MGDGALELGFKAGIRGASKKLPGCKDPVVCCDKLDELLEVFLRSCPWPVLNCTSSGEEGCDTRLGDGVGCVFNSGDAGRFVPIVDEKALFIGIAIAGLDSRDGAGDAIVGEVSPAGCLP
jgi:hypothetical protein